MNCHYQFLLALSLCALAAGCMCLPVQPYDPPTESRIDIKRLYDDREKNYGSSLIASASFLDRYAGAVRINDDTLTMSISAADTFNVVQYARYVPTSYKGSINFEGEPLRIRVEGNSAVPALDEQYSVPQRIRIESPAPDDTIRSSGFLLRWNAATGDTTHVFISGRIHLDTLVVGTGSLMVDESYFTRSQRKEFPKLFLQLGRKWSVRKSRPNQTDLCIYVESQTNRTLVVGP
jgi:hypothetical protein